MLIGIKTGYDTLHRGIGGLNVVFLKTKAVFSMPASCSKAAVRWPATAKVFLSAMMNTLEPPYFLTTLGVSSRAPDRIMNSFRSVRCCLPQEQDRPSAPNNPFKSRLAMSRILLNLLPLPVYRPSSAAAGLVPVLVRPIQISAGHQVNP